MLPISEVKKLLGSDGNGLSDGEIKQIAELVDRLTDVMFELWLKERHDPQIMEKLKITPKLIK